MRALIVDDSHFIREYIRQQLEPMGVECAEAEDGSRALQCVEEDAANASPSRFDLMLVDVNMPVMNGLECVRRLRSAKMAPAMKIMMVTTEADNRFIGKALEYGADEFLMKPFSPQSLREKLALMGLDWQCNG